MVPVIIASVLITLITGVASDCPVKWNEFGGKCYFVSHDTESWADALTICEFFGGNLAKVDSVQENAFLANLTRHGTNLHKAGFWIGLDDIEQEGTWVWTQDKSVLSSGAGVAIWGKGQPDNTNDNENCVWLNGNDAGNWYDGHCSNAKNYMCEKEAGNPGIVG